MSIYLVDKLISDFDETISQEDTIQSLVTAAMQNRDAEGLQVLNAWRETVDWYITRHSQICNEWLDMACEHRGESVVGFLSTFEPLEAESIERVMKQKFLAGLSREQLRKTGSQVQKRDGAEACLSEMRHAGVKVEILSANWSQTFVEEALKGFFDSVVANRLLFDERGYSTGDIQLRVVSAHDKWRHFKSRRSETGLTGYVGDSISDLRAILEADVGILVGENQTCLRTINRFQIPIQRVTQSSSRTANRSETGTERKRILHADSWETVNHLLKSPQLA